MLSLFIALISSSTALAKIDQCSPQHQNVLSSRLICAADNRPSVVIEIFERKGCPNPGRFEAVYRTRTSLMAPEHGPFEGDSGGGIFFRNRKGVEDYLLIDTGLIYGTATEGGLKEVHFSSEAPKHLLFSCRQAL